jgi:hypothetical protein
MNILKIIDFIDHLFYDKNSLKCFTYTELNHPETLTIFEYVNKDLASEEI